MDDVEDFSIDIDQARSDEECTRRVKFLPLLLLQEIYFLLRRDLLFILLAVLFHLFSHLVAHFLQFYGDLSPLLLDQLLQLFVVICFLSEADSLTWVSLCFVELEPKRDMHSDSPEMVDHYLLHVDVFESVWVTD